MSSSRRDTGILFHQVDAAGEFPRSLGPKQPVSLDGITQPSFTKPVVSRRRRDPGRFAGNRSAIAMLMNVNF
jgi:hypothetical protein